MRITDNKGVALIFTFIIMATIAVIVMGFLYMMTNRLRATSAEAASMQAFWLAEAGVQQASYKIMTDTPSGYRSNPSNISSTPLGAGTYSAAVSKDAGTKVITITSTGTVSGISRQIRSLRYDSFFSRAAFGGASGGGSTIGINMGGTSNTDSYDSSLGLYGAALPGGGVNIGLNGDVGTNGDISVSGSANIGGDASTGPLGTFSDQSAVDGTINHDLSVTLPAVVVPSLSWSSLPTIQNNKTTDIPSGDYTAGKIDIGAHTVVNITGPANILLTGSTSIDIGSQAVINVTVASTGPVIIYAYGDVDMGGQGIINATYNPANFQLYGYGTGSVDYSFSGGSSLYGLVYAPNADFTITGNSDLYGSFVVDTIAKLTGTGGIHYDEAAIGVTSPTAEGSLPETDWREIIPPA